MGLPTLKAHLLATYFAIPLIIESASAVARTKSSHSPGAHRQHRGVGPRIRAFQGMDRARGIPLRPQQLSEEHPQGIVQRVALDPHAEDGQGLLGLSVEHA